jgi:hypothetical protein
MLKITRGTVSTKEEQALEKDRYYSFVTAKYTMKLPDTTKSRHEKPNLPKFPRRSHDFLVLCTHAHSPSIARALRSSERAVSRSS